MAKVYIPSGLLSPSDERALQDAVDEAVREKNEVDGFLCLALKIS